ncbi:MAG: ATP-binding cassette domain-containing protein [Nibricoccus sp.]
MSSAPQPSSLPNHRAGEVAIRCEKLTRYLGQGEGRVHVLREVSFQATAGTVTAIVGPSGCGKSTLLYLLGLLDRPEGGEIWIGGRNLAEATDEQRTATRNEHIGFVFQFHFLLPEFTALENVMLPMRKLGRLSHAAMQDRATKLLDAVGLGARDTPACDAALWR